MWISMVNFILNLMILPKMEKLFTSNNYFVFVFFIFICLLKHEQTNKQTIFKLYVCCFKSQQSNQPVKCVSCEKLFHIKKKKKQNKTDPIGNYF